MSDLQRRSGSKLSRRTREQRAYRLVLATGTFGAIAVVGVVLSLVNVIGATIPLLAILAAIVCLVLLRRTVR